MSNLKSESSRCLHCKNPQCRAGCPVGYDIPAFLQKYNEGEFAQAAGVVGHLFGEVCGYVCPKDKQCRGHCVLGKKGSPIDVGAVERSVFAEYFPRLAVLDDDLAGIKIAVVGGGVSGVTFAEQCYRHGAQVDIFEKNKLLHTLDSVPDFRLPKDALRRIVAAVENSGICVKKQAVDNNLLQNLLQSYDAVYLAVGVTVANKMRIEGEEHAILADDFLRGNSFGDAVIVGGGNTAMDCARLNVRHGYKTTVAYRRSRQDMPAFAQEVECAEREGVRFRFNFAPVGVEKRGGKLAATFAETFSEGRGKLTVTDRRETVECDILVVATGNGFDTSVFPTERYVAIDENNCVGGNLYAGGDATGKNLVAQAVADALNASRAVHSRYKR